MKSSYDVKRTLKKFKSFGVAAAAFMIIVILCYANILNLTRKDAAEEFSLKLDSTFSNLEKEINMQRGVVRNMSETEAYSALLNGSSDLVLRADAARAYSGVKSVSPDSRSFLIFRKNGICIDENGVARTLKSSYSSTWNLFVNGEPFYIDSAEGQIFMRRHEGGFEGIYAINDITQSHKYGMVYLQSLNPTGEEISDAAHIIAYDTASVLKNAELSKYAGTFLVTANGGRIYPSTGSDKPAEYDLHYKYSALGISIDYNISERYVFLKLRAVNIFFVLMILLFLAAGTAITIGISANENRRIKDVLGMAGDMEDNGFEDGEDMYKHIGYVYKNLNVRLEENAETIKELIMMRMLAFGLDADGYRSVSEWIGFPCIFAVLRNYSQKHRVWGLPLDEFLSESDVRPICRLDVSETETVLFLPVSSESCLSGIPFGVCKKCRADIRGVYAYVQTAEEIPSLYGRMKNTIRYLEYGQVQPVGETDAANRTNRIRGLVSKSRQLYELIRSGNAFEAKRTVYEQWYTLSREFRGTDGIEPLFYSQTSVISQLSADLKIDVKPPEFDSSKDIVTLAFEITESIEQISANIKQQGSRKNSVKGNQIADYIKQRYTDSAFYMPELVGRFEMSDRAIVRLLKSSTGKNFSDYVGELRVKHAEELLSGTSMPVADIATNSGFDSSNSLYKAFKKVYGVSPTAYRSSRGEKETNNDILH